MINALGIFLISGYITFQIAKFFTSGQTENNRDEWGHEVRRTPARVAQDEYTQGCVIFALIYPLVCVFVYLILEYFDLDFF